MDTSKISVGKIPVLLIKESLSVYVVLCINVNGSTDISILKFPEEIKIAYYEQFFKSLNEFI